MFRSQATKQRMDHFMKQNEKAKDGPFYEAKRKQRMDHFMKQAFVL
jgi:hypothetical protein